MFWQQALRGVALGGTAVFAMGKAIGRTHEFCGHFSFLLLRVRCIHCGHKPSLK